MSIFSRITQSQSMRSVWGVGIIAVCFLILVIVMSGTDLIAGLPSLEQLENPKPDLATTVFTADGQLLGKFKIKIELIFLTIQYLRIL